MPIGTVVSRPLTNGIWRRVAIKPYDEAALSERPKYQKRDCKPEHPENTTKSRALPTQIFMVRDSSGWLVNGEAFISMLSGNWRSSFLQRRDANTKGLGQRVLEAWLLAAKRNFLCREIAAIAIEMAVVQTMRWAHTNCC